MRTVIFLLALTAAATSLVLPQQENANSCFFCEIIVKIADNPADREAHVVENKFNAACDAEFGKIPFIDKKCKSYGDAKIDSIINELESGTAPEDVCKALKEC